MQSCCQGMQDGRQNPVDSNGNHVLLCDHEERGIQRAKDFKTCQQGQEMEAQWSEGKIDLKGISKRLDDKAGWTIESKAYKESDITSKKGSYQYWLDSKQIAPQNTINEQATRYMLFFFTTLMDEYGFGKERLTRVCDYLNELLVDYQQDKTTVRAWKQAIYDEAGVIIEMPIDPLTQTVGSMMTN